MQQMWGCTFDSNKTPALLNFFNVASSFCFFYLCKLQHKIVQKVDQLSSSSTSISWPDKQVTDQPSDVTPTTSLFP